MPSSRPSVVFVCQKNAGKSQMAAALMRELLGHAESGRGSRAAIDVVSAGTKPGEGLNAQSVAALAELGIDVGDEHPKPLTDAMLATADVVVVLGAEAWVEAPEGTLVETWLTEEPSERGIEGMARMRLVRDDIHARVAELHGRLLAEG